MNNTSVDFAISAWPMHDMLKPQPPPEVEVWNAALEPLEVVLYFSKEKFPSPIS